MNGLKQLIQDNTHGKIIESDYPEFVKLLIKEQEILLKDIEDRNKMVMFYEEQRKDIRKSMEFLVIDTDRVNKLRKVKK